MRKVQLLLVCLVLSVAASAADKVVKLPKPNLSRAGTVMKALSERQSTREYASKEPNVLTSATNLLLSVPTNCRSRYAFCSRFI